MYLRFLYTQAANDDKCLSELQKHAGAHPRSADILCISGSFLANVNDAEVVRSLKLDRLIKENGAIIYERDGVELVRDEGARVVVNASKNRWAIDAALALASAKWGKNLNLHGPEELQQLTRESAKENSMGIKFQGSSSDLGSGQNARHRLNSAL